MNLAEMAAEVEQVNREKGWYDDSRTFGELIALLHSEVSEALEAYRHWGLNDVTPKVISDEEVTEMLGISPVDLDFPAYKPYVPKPEGVGSELADVLIRLLDMSKRYGINLEREVSKHHGMFGMNINFGDSVCVLHMLISRLAYAAEDFPPDPDHPVEPHYARIYLYLAQWAEFLGIDLEAEYRRKVDFNKTRPYRHGGKKL